MSVLNKYKKRLKQTTLTPRQEMINNYEYYLKFLREYRMWFIGYLIQVLGFFFVFYLYRLPLEYFGYSLLFTGLIGATLLFFQFLAYRKRLINIQSIFQLTEVGTDGMTPIDKAYLAKMLELDEQMRAQIFGYKEREEERQGMVKMWAHQMKVPLAALSLMSQTQQIDAVNVDAQLVSLEHYVNNLLQYLRLTDHVSDFLFEEVAVRQLVVELVKQYRVHFFQKHLSVQIEGDWTVKSDKKWLSFAISQILDNAIKYSFPDGAITIELHQGLSISDQGMGILEEDIPRLFEQGFTGFNGHRHQKATGLGLYMTKRILDQLEMEIHVQSQVDHGTKVTITQT